MTTTTETTAASTEHSIDLTTLAPSDWGSKLERYKSPARKQTVSKGERGTYDRATNLMLAGLIGGFSILPDHHWIVWVEVEAERVEVGPMTLIEAKDWITQAEGLAGRYGRTIQRREVKDTRPIDV